MRRFLHLYSACCVFGFNLLRSIRFIATAQSYREAWADLSVSISYGAFGSLRPRSVIGEKKKEKFQSPTEHSVHCDLKGSQQKVKNRSVSISYGAFGSLRPLSIWVKKGHFVVSISYGAFGSLRHHERPQESDGERFQSPTEHSVHCDGLQQPIGVRAEEVSISYGAFGSLRQTLDPGRPGPQPCFNLLRSIRFIATPWHSTVRGRSPGGVSISYGAFGSLRLFNSPSLRYSKLVSISYGAFGSLRPCTASGYDCVKDEFQSPTEHSVHCDYRQCQAPGATIILFQSPTEHSVHCDYPSPPLPSPNLNVSISYGAFGSLRQGDRPGGIRAGRAVSISYGAFGSLRRGAGIGW